MDLPRNRFKGAIADSGRIPLGTWLVSGTAVAAEAMGCSGYDFVVLDTEHTPIDMAGMVDMLRAIEGTPAGVLTRVPWNDMVMIKRALDAGAQALLVPFVQNADEARRAVAYTRYPPDGVRGVAAVHRASRHGNVQDYHRRAAQELCVVCQVETIDAFAHLPEIAAVPGVDSVFVGPADLSASMGRLGDMKHPEVQAKLREAAQLCRAAGKPAGILAPDPETVATYVDYGYTWVAMANDVAMMVGRAREWIARVRRTVPQMAVRS